MAFEMCFSVRSEMHGLEQQAGYEEFLHVFIEKQT